MENSLSAWQQEVLEIALEDDEGAPGSLRRFHKIERELRTILRQPNRSDPSALAMAVRTHFRVKDSELKLTDYLLSKADLDVAGGWSGIEEKLDDPEHIVGRLEILLKSSSSKWTVGIRSAGKLGLVQRVPEGVQSAVDGTISSSGHAGIRLSEAWAAAFGIAPDPSRAYALAVKAVEDAAIPVVSPNDTMATLGKINSQMRKTGEWGLPLAREDEFATTSATLLSMMKMLWAGQADRHGGNPDATLVITQEAAEVAVLTATTLVHWFTSGAVTR
jgi:hypothetical protein